MLYQRFPEEHRLQEEHRNSRRSIADAIDVLRDRGGFGDDDCAKIRIGLIRLPSDHVVGLVDVLFENRVEQKVYVVSLRTCARIRASRGAARRYLFEIDRLDGAVVDAAGNVRLGDGTQLRAVEVVPIHLPFHPTVHDWRIVHAAIAALRAEERCYRNLQKDLPRAEQGMVPDWRAIDCSKLSGLELPPLKELALCIAEKDPTLGELSQQTIANALRRFGMRIPKLRPIVR
jgi:hypothetical protein